jgi:hypothetical protein
MIPVSNAYEAAGNELEVTALRAVISGALVALSVEMVLLNALAMAPRQEKNYLLSPDALRQQDEMLSKSRKDLLLARTRGFNPAVISRPPAPVTILDLLAQIHASLVHHETRAWRILRAVPARSRRMDLTDQQRLTALETAVANVRDVAWLSDVEADLQRLVQASKDLLDGEQKSMMDAPCPHCGRMTLVIHKGTGLVRCEADPKTGHRETCLCSVGAIAHTHELDDSCGCTHGRRHQWKRADGGWDRLARLLQQNETKEHQA